MDPEEDSERFSERAPPADSGRTPSPKLLLDREHFWTMATRFEPCADPARVRLLRLWAKQIEHAAHAAMATDIVIVCPDDRDLENRTAVFAARARARLELRLHQIRPTAEAGALLARLFDQDSFPQLQIQEPKSVPLGIPRPLRQGVASLTPSTTFV